MLIVDASHGGYRILEYVLAVAGATERQRYDGSMEPVWRSYRHEYRWIYRRKIEPKNFARTHVASTDCTSCEYRFVRCACMDERILAGNGAVPSTRGFAGMASNVYAGSVHASIDDNERATTFSLQSAAIALAAVVVGPMCGWLTDHFGLGVGMSSTLIFFIVPIAVECYRGVQRRDQSAR